MTDTMTTDRNRPRHIWRLECFGGLRAHRGDALIDKFRTQKTAALLALLALRGSQNRESACALLWPDAAPEAARNSLSAALSALRRDLGDDFVCADRQGVALSSGAFETDVDAFDAALKSRDFSRAVALYAGPLLPGFHDDPFPALAGEYEEKARGAFAARLDELESAQNADELRKVSRRAMALFGDDERWFLALMRAHRIAGDLDAALRTYEALGRHARKTGDVASETARQLAKLLRRDKEQQSREAEPAPSSSAPATARSEKNAGPDELEESTAHPSPLVLPSQWTRFFGREAEREMLRAWLCDGEGAGLLITLTGSGGSGKTRLAIETVRALNDDPNDAECSRAREFLFVPLASLQDAELLLPAIRDALGLTASPDGAPLSQVERALRSRPCVLLLDNFEQLMPQGALCLHALRERLPQATFLVTSRVLLHLPGEREFPVSPLPTPLPHTPARQLADYPSTALFCDRAGLTLSDANAEAVGALCRRLDGIPLALELAAARAKLLSPAQILERLAKHPDFLQSRELGVPERHKTLRATIEWSTDLLPSELRDFFTRLSVFRGGWTLEAAEEVCDEPDAFEALTLLRASSLIRTDEGRSDNGDEPRFRMLETLREFGQERLTGQAREKTERAFFDSFLTLAQRAASEMQGPEQTTWLRRLDVEQDNLRAALAWARDHDAARGLMLATALIDFWETRLNLGEGRGWIETFLRATAPQNAPVASATTLSDRALALSGAGRLAFYASDLDSASARLSEGLEAARQSDDAATLVYATRSSALAATVENATRARDLGRDAVRAARESGDKALLLKSLVDLGFAEINVSDFDASRAVCTEAIALARREGDERTLALAITTLAIACVYQGRLDEGRELVEESEVLSRRLGAEWELMVSLALRGHLRSMQGEHDDARRDLNAALEIVRTSIRDSWTTVNVLLSVSYAFARRGDARGAARLMAACDALAERIGYTLMPFLVADREHFLALSRAVLGEETFADEWRRGRKLSHDEAIAFAIAPDRDADELAARSRAMSGAGRLAWHKADFQDSRALVTQSLEVAQQSGDTASFVHAVAAFMRFANSTGDERGEMTRCRALAQEAVRRSRATGDDSLLLEAFIAQAWAEVAFENADLAALRALHEEGLALGRRLGDELRTTALLVSLTIIERREGFPEKAMALADEALGICRRLDAPFQLFAALWAVACCACELEHVERAQTTSAELVRLCRDNPTFRWNMANALLTVADARLLRGLAPDAAVLEAATQAMCERIGYRFIPIVQADAARIRNAARQLLGDTAFEAAQNRGRALSLDDAIEFALGSEPEAGAGGDLASTRARALAGAGRLAWYGDDFADSRRLVVEGLEAARRAGDTSSFVYAVVAWVRFSAVTGDENGEIAEGRVLSAEAVARSRALGDDSLLLEALIAQIYAHQMSRRLEGLRALLDEALALARRLGDEGRGTVVLTARAVLAYDEGDFATSLAFAEESTLVCRRLDAPFPLFAALWITSNAARELGQLDLAGQSVNEALTLCRDDLSFRWNVVNALLTAAYAGVRLGRTRDAATLMSAAHGLSERLGYRLVPSLRPDFERYRELARRELGEADFTVAWQRGRALSVEDATALARRLTDAPSSPDAPGETPGDAMLAARARALSGAARLAWHDSDLNASRAHVTQGLEIARRSGDLASFVTAVSAFVRFAMNTGEIDGAIAQARVLSEEAVARCRKANDRPLLLESLISLAYSRAIVLALDGLTEINDEAIALARALGDEHSLARALTNHAGVNRWQGRHAFARALLTESIAICRRLGSPWDLLAALWTQADVTREQGEFDLAARAVTEVLGICRDTPEFRWGLSNVLLTASYLLAQRGEPAQAAVLMGAAQARLEESGYELVPCLRPERARFEAQTRARLGEVAWESAWNRGHAMSHEEAVELALQWTTARQTDSATATRAVALSGAGRLASYSYDVAQSRALLEQGLDAARQSGDLAAFVASASAFTRLSMTTGDVESDLARSRALSEEAVARCRAAGDNSLLLDSLMALNYVLVMVNEIATARPTHAEAIALARELRDDVRLGRALTHLACAACFEGRLEEAGILLDESEPLSRRSSELDLAGALWARANVHREEGDLAASRDAWAESLTASRDNAAFRWGVDNTLLTAGYSFARAGNPRAAARLIASAMSRIEADGNRLVPCLRPHLERYQAVARQMLTAREWNAALKEGRAMSIEAAIDFALSAEHDHGNAEAAATRAMAFSGAARLASYSYDVAPTRALLEQGLNAARQSGDLAALVASAWAFAGLARTTGDVDGDLARALSLSEEAVSLCRAAGDRSLLLDALLTLGDVRATGEDQAWTRAVLPEAAALARELNDEVRLSRALRLWACVAYLEGRHEEASALLDEAEPVARGRGWSIDLSSILWARAQVHREQGRLDKSREAWAENLTLSRDNAAFRWGVDVVILVAAYSFVKEGNAPTAARLIASAMSRIERDGNRLVPCLRPDLDRYQSAAREMLSDAEWTQALEEGRAMSIEAAIDFALSR